ncbi:MAG: ribbon-helix-helix domain-containing protein [Firmicutes bacterium]|nr:ribbon-helix-helix domain-containing protein [Bacillota bacterium]
MPPKKMGRPPSNNPKSETIRVRVDTDTIKKLDDCSRKLDTNRSDIVRKGIDMVHDDLDKK